MLIENVARQIDRSIKDILKLDTIPSEIEYMRNNFGTEYKIDLSPFDKKLVYYKTGDKNKI